MSASPKLRFGVVAAGLSCLFAGYVVAQQQTVRERVDAAIDQPAAQNPANSQTFDERTGQIDRAITPGREHTANFRGNPANTGARQKDVERYVIACLLTKNQGEVELGQLAQQQSQNAEVKEFAQKMVQDHGKLVKDLQQIKAGEHKNQAAAATTATGQTDIARDTASDRSNATDSTIAAAGNSAIDQLVALDRQIAERCLQAAREELQAKQGVEFDKCYIGSQINGHMQMLAALEVLQQQGPQQVQQVAQQAQPTVRQHLEHAKQIMKQLEGANTTGSGARAARQTSPTQR